MKESKLTSEKPDKIKRMTINIEKKAEMIVEREDGKPPKVTGYDKGEIENLVIDGKPIPNNFPDDTVIFTHHSPGCGYYYFNRMWWYR